MKLLRYVLTILSLMNFIGVLFLIIVIVLEYSAENTWSALFVLVDATVIFGWGAYYISVEILNDTNKYLSIFRFKDRWFTIKKFMLQKIVYHKYSISSVSEIDVPHDIGAPMRSCYLISCINKRDKKLFLLAPQIQSSLKKVLNNFKLIYVSPDKNFISFQCGGCWVSDQYTDEYPSIIPLLYTAQQIPEGKAVELAL